MHPSARPRLRWLTTLAALLAALTATTSAQAQSSYSMTVLRQNTSRLLVEGLLIDSQDRVLTSLSYFDHYAWHITNQFPTQYALLPEYKRFPARWPASTLSSVSPTKVIKTENDVAFASPDGNKLYLLSYTTTTGVYDTLTGKTLPVDGQAKAVNSAGAIVGDRVREGATPQTTSTDETSGAALWVPNKPRQDLALPSPYVGARAIAVSEKNVVVGEVFEPGTLRSRAARWVNGTLEVLVDPSSAVEASYATAVNDAGHVLVAHQAFSIVSSSVDPITGQQVIERKFGPDRYSVVFNGTDVPITSTTPGAQAVANGMNASGTVVGRVSPTLWYFGGFQHRSNGIPMWPLDGSRAFIWKNGVMTDLTTLMASKGVKVAAGAVFIDAVSINDKGSIAAVYRDKSGTSSLVRLNAKP